VSQRWWGAQVLLFKGDGGELWAARRVTPVEIEQLRDGLDFLEQCKSQRAKPFWYHSAELGVTVAALDGDTDLYFVIIGVEPDTEVAEARLVPFLGPELARLELGPEVQLNIDREHRGALALSYAVH
jgi:hypothetical protein